MTHASRYSSASRSIAPGPIERDESVSAPNMRNASRSISATPANSRRGGTASVTPFREESATPGPGETGGRGRYGTPLFLARDTPFGEDDEDEEAHEEYTTALREGRLRLPSVSRPAGPELDERGMKKKGKGKRKASWRDEVGDDDDDDELDDIPETLEAMSQRLVASSEIEEGLIRIQGGWEERADGEESAVMGREEPGD